MNFLATIYLTAYLMKPTKRRKRTKKRHEERLALEGAPVELAIEIFNGEFATLTLKKGEDPKKVVDTFAREWERRSRGMWEMPPKQKGKKLDEVDNMDDNTTTQVGDEANKEHDGKKQKTSYP